MHLFSKRPVEPIVDIDSFRKSLARRVALAALQIRLNVGGRSDDPAFTFVEFNQLDSAREGCAVCSLDMTAEPHKWKEAIAKSLSEIRKLGVFGVTMGEMERYASSLMTDAEQLAAQGDRISHGDQLSYLMETVANGHTFMSPEQSYDVTAKALSSLTVEDVNYAAAELCSHVMAFKEGAEPLQGPVIAVACTPKGAGVGDPAYCDEDSLVQAIYEACQLEVEPEEDVVVPFTLVPEDELATAMELNPPSWLGGQFTDGTPNTAPDTITRPFTLRRLGNGIRIGVAYNPHESQRGHLRLVAPGGRDAEQRLGFKKGSMAIGARTMQEGGAFGPWTREQVELFCVDHSFDGRDQLQRRIHHSRLRLPYDQRRKCRIWRRRPTWNHRNGIGHANCARNYRWLQVGRGCIGSKQIELPNNARKSPEESRESQYRTHHGSHDRTR